MRKLLVILLAVAASGCADKRAGVDPACFTRSSDKVGGPISLISNTGAHTTEGGFKGRKTLVFFGYTHCPDFCPGTLYKIGTAIKMMPRGVKPPRTVFISVDPLRDTPESLTQYIASNGFPTDITALTGSEDELEAAAKAFAATFSRVEDPDSAAGYVMDHSTILYLMDERWKLLSFFTTDERPEAMAKCIAALS
jgi:protein SCO1/2